MSGTTDSPYDWAADSGPFYVFLGLYVAAFQLIEGKLDEIILLEVDPEQRAQTLKRLAGMTNRDKIAAAKRAALNAERFERIELHNEWKARILEICERLEQERARRNGILHSQYWVRGLEHGMNAIRTHTRRAEGALEVSSEEMTRKRMDEILEEVSILLFHVGQAHLQLIHWTP